MKQIRSYSTAQIRIAPDGDGRKLVGLAIPYNSLSRNLGGFVERFMPGAVSDSVKRGEIVAVLNHNLSQSLATQRSGNLKLRDTDQGLEVEINMPDTSYANDAIELIRNGDGTGMSFGFNPVDVDWVKENGTNVAVVRKAELGEVSVLTGPPPAYSATSIALRALSDEEIDTVEHYGIDIEQLAGVFLSIKRGLPLSDVETQIMHQARSLFAQLRRPYLEAAKIKAASLLID